MRPARMILGFVSLATLQAGAAFGGDADGRRWNPKATAEYLDGRGDWWLNWSDAARGQGTVCASCHTAMPFALARPVVGERLGETAAGVIEKYLVTQFPDQPLHHRAHHLWASSWLPGILTAADKKALVEELLNAQEADGGWSLPKLGKKASGASGWESRGAYPEGWISDGYATGLVVLALKRAGVANDNPELEKGIGWLVANQQEGAWPVNYLNVQRNPQSNVGKFMRDAATAFAILALTEPTAAIAPSEK